MGNALRFLYGHCCQPSFEDSEELGPHGVSATAVCISAYAPHGASAAAAGVSALVCDIFNCEKTSKVPEELSKHVKSSQKAQAKWYKKLAKAWTGAEPPPKTPEEASRFVIQTLKRHRKADVEGLLAFYGLPLPNSLVEDSNGVPTSLTKGVKFELQTLPVDAKAVPDGDTIIVYVSTTDPQESSRLTVPKDVETAYVQRSQAQALKDHAKAKAVHRKITDAGYRVIDLPNNEAVLARKYRIRLRGIDAPESSMPYGKEAREELARLLQGKCLKVLVYAQDLYGRCVGDIYCDGKFVQETMLKKGFAWHYTAYDQRQELARWEKEAQEKRAGLWASSNPEKPWEWRKNKRQGG